MSLNQATFFSPILALVKDLFLCVCIFVCITNHIVWALEKGDVIQGTFVYLARPAFRSLKAERSELGYAVV